MRKFPSELKIRKRCRKAMARSSRKKQNDTLVPTLFSKLSYANNHCLSRYQKMVYEMIYLGNAGFKKSNFLTLRLVRILKMLTCFANAHAVGSPSQVTAWPNSSFKWHPYNVTWTVSGLLQSKLHCDVKKATAARGFLLKMFLTNRCDPSCRGHPAIRGQRGCPFPHWAFVFSPILDDYNRNFVSS